MPRADSAPAVAPGDNKPKFRGEDTLFGCVIPWFRGDAAFLWIVIPLFRGDKTFFGSVIPIFEGFAALSGSGNFRFLGDVVLLPLKLLKFPKES